MRHGSLESGIGMFDYASEMMGWENVFHCEINTFCRTILKYYWPKAKSYADIFEFSGTEWRGNVDVITAGFPCQPFSHAGQRKGSKDDRFIWPENMRIFREAQPPFIVCENVPGLLTIENGMVFEQVCLDLENEGYEVQTFIIPACATNKVHRRDRLWIIGYAEHLRQYGTENRKSCIKGSEYNKTRENQIFKSQGSTLSRDVITDSDCNGHGNNNRFREDTGTEKEGEGYGLQRKRIRNEFGGIDTDVTDTLNEGLQGNQQRCALEQGKRTSRSFTKCLENETWLEAATRLCFVDDGNTGRLDRNAILKATGAKSDKGSHYHRWRTESLKAAGNTIIWEIAFEIFKTIEQYEQNTSL